MIGPERVTAYSPQGAPGWDCGLLWRQVKHSCMPSFSVGQAQAQRTWLCLFRAGCGGGRTGAEGKRKLRMKPWKKCFSKSNSLWGRYKRGPISEIEFLHRAPVL